MCTALRHSVIAPNNPAPRTHQVGLLCVVKPRQTIAVRALQRPIVMMSRAVWEYKLCAAPKHKGRCELIYLDGQAKDEREELMLSGAMSVHSSGFVLE